MLVLVCCYQGLELHQLAAVCLAEWRLAGQAVIYAAYDLADPEMAEIVPRLDVSIEVHITHCTVLE